MGGKGGGKTHNIQVIKITIESTAGKIRRRRSPTRNIRSTSRDIGGDIITSPIPHGDGGSSPECSVDAAADAVEGGAVGGADVVYDSAAVVSAAIAAAGIAN